jgi:hypothetical protein
MSVYANRLTPDERQAQRELRKMIKRHQKVERKVLRLVLSVEKTWRASLYARVMETASLAP